MANAQRTPKISVYEKKTGKEFKLSYPVDVAEWLASGKYTKEAPKAKTETK